MELPGYLRAIRKYWWVVVLVTLIGAGGGLALALGTSPKYASKVTFFVSTTSHASGTALASDQFAQARVNSYVSLLSSDLLAQQVAAEVGGGVSAAQIAKETVGTSELNTVLLTATVTDASAARSLRIAQAIATEFGVLVDNLENQTPATSPVALKVTSGPTLNPVPVSPRKSLDLAIGVLVGLALGIGSVAVAEMAGIPARSPKHQALAPAGGDRIEPVRVDSG